MLIIQAASPIVAISTVHLVGQRLGQSWPWYVIRAAGFTAAGLLILLMLSGIGQATGLIYRYIEPIKVWAIHKTMAIALGIAITIHVGFLLIDHYIHFSLAELFIPFLSTYNNKQLFLGLPLSWAATGFGVLAMYGVIIIIASSLGWIDTRKKAWRKLHYLSYLVAFFMFLHALYAGTDLKYGVFRDAWIAIGGIIVFGGLLRLRRRGTVKRNQE